MDRSVFYSLFCGGGGFSAGAKMEGCEVVLAVDSNKKMLAAHASNFPESTHLLYEIGSEDVATFALKLRAYVEAHLGKGEAWHLHGSPSCQTFSVANTRGINGSPADPRTNLTFYFLDLVLALAPKSWSFENVPAALKHVLRYAPLGRGPPR